MTQMTRRVLIALGALAGVAVLASLAFAANVKHVKTGYYEAGITGMNGGFSVGVWDITKTKGKYSMVVDPMYSGIYPPDSGKCGTSAPLTQTEIPLSKNFSFSVRDEEQIALPNGDAATQKVKWNGRWTTSHDVDGKITITVGNCTDKRKWGGSGGY